MMNQGMIGYGAHVNPGMIRGMPECGMMSEMNKKPFD